MGASTIGGVQCIALRRGSLNTAQAILRDDTPPGVDGHSFLKLGKRAEPQQVVGVIDYTTLANLAAGKAALLALQGTLVTVEDDLGTSYANVAVLRAQSISERKLETAVGGVNGGAFLLTMAFRLQMTG